MTHSVSLTVAFNRTGKELKHYFTDENIGREMAFNRTGKELKRSTQIPTIESVFDF